VPVHLRNAPTKLMQELGYGRAYRYAHDEPEAYAAGERYFPDAWRHRRASTSRRRAGGRQRSANAGVFAGTGPEDAGETRGLSGVGPPAPIGTHEGAERSLWPTMINDTPILAPAKGCGRNIHRGFDIGEPRPAGSSAITLGA